MYTRRLRIGGPTESNFRMNRFYSSIAGLLAAAIFATPSYALAPREMIELVKLGAEVMVSSTSETFDLIELIENGGSSITVKTDGFSSFDLTQLAETGPAKFHVTSSTDPFDAYRLSEIAGGRVKVKAEGFSLHHLKQMASQGALFEVSQTTPIFDIKSLLEVAAGRVLIFADGFTLMECKELAMMGGTLVYGHVCPDHVRQND